MDYYKYEGPHLTLKEGSKVKSESSKRFGAHDLKEVIFTSKTSTTNNKGDIGSFKFGHLRFSNLLPTNQIEQTGPNVSQARFHNREDILKPW